MKILLYKFNGEKIEVDKSANLTLLKELNGTFRYESSIINPVVDIDLESVFNVVDSNSVKVTTTNMGRLIILPEVVNLLTANYVHIPDFNRYYYVADAVVVNNQLIRLMLHVDVLYSFKDKILTNTGLIERNEFLYNNRIVDTLRDFNYPKEIEYHNITHVDGVILDSFNPFGEYLVAVTCDDATQQQNMPSVNDNDLDINLHTRIGKVTQGLDRNTIFYVGDYIDPLFKAIYEDQNLRSYVKYLKAFPFTMHKKLYVDSSSQVTDWSHNYHIGNKHDIYNANALQMPQNNVIIKKLADFILDDNVAFMNSYRNSEPYTMVELWIPFYNYLKLPLSQLYDHRLQLYYLTSIGDGSTTAILYDASEHKQLFSSIVECGVNIPFSTTNSYENEKRKDGLIMSTAIGTLSSILSTAFGVLSHNPVMTAGGVMTGISTITKAVTSANQIIDSASVGVTSSTSGLYNSLVPYLRITYQNIVQVDEDEYAHMHGKPLMNYYQLSSLSGYTKVSDIHLTGLDIATIDEIESIETLLKNGVLLP